MNAIVLDETGTFGATEHFFAIPMTSMRVEKTRAGARLIVMDLSCQILLPPTAWIPTEKADPEKIRLQTPKFTTRTADKASEIGHRLAEATSELGKKAASSAIGRMAVETATELGKKVAEKASKLGHRAADATSEISKKVSDSVIGKLTMENAVGMGKKTSDKASAIGHNAAEAASELSKKIADSPVGRNTVEVASELGKKTAEAATKLLDKAANTGALGRQVAEEFVDRNEKAVAKDERSAKASTDHRGS